MTEKIIHDIEGYIRFLEASGYTISLSFMKSSMKALLLPLLKYDYHPHRICDYLKANPGTQGCCVKNKEALLKKEIKDAYYGCCYAGVEEFIFPVRQDDEAVVCIHVSGYRGRRLVYLLRLEFCFWEMNLSR